MSGETEWRDRVRAELLRAETARAAGNEGMARVCARRAAGIAAGEYLTRRGLTSAGRSSYDRLSQLSQITDLPAPIQEVATHFLVRITPEHTLPIEADLVAEAKWLVYKLLETQVKGET